LIYDLDSDTDEDNTLNALKKYSDIKYGDNKKLKYKIRKRQPGKFTMKQILVILIIFSSLLKNISNVILITILYTIIIIILK